MPAYQAEALIGRAIESVLAQTFDDWELVVTDDGSTDGTGDIVRSFAERDGRVRLVRQDNAGCGAARDTAVRASAGEYILRFDTDDVLLPGYLERMDRFIAENPGFDIYSSNGWHVHEDGSRTLARPGAFYEVERSFSLEEMFAANHIFTISVFSRDLFDRIDGIRPDVYCEDLDFWFRAFAFGGATHRFLPAPLALYTVSDTQMTADVDRVLASRIRVYADVLASGRLDPHLEDVARAAIRRTEQDRWIFARRNRVHRAATRLFGKRAGTWVSAAIHGVGRLIRPLVARLAPSPKGES